MRGGELFSQHPGQWFPAGIGAVRFDAGRIAVRVHRTHRRQTGSCLRPGYLALGQLSLTGGLRFDNYSGQSSGRSFQPRAGASYYVKSTGTVLRLSYARLFETPYNENLILSSSTGAGGLGTTVFGAQAVTPLNPGRRDQFNAGFQQAFGKILVLDADYSW